MDYRKMLVAYARAVIADDPTVGLRCLLDVGDCADDEAAEFEKIRREVWPQGLGEYQET